MSSSIFSTYSQGENRVTSTVLAVFERINPALVERILQRLLTDDKLELVRFENQPSGDQSRPDGLLRGSFSFWMETKTSRNSVRQEQLKKHLSLLAPPGERDDRLIVLTPDGSVPVEVARLQQSNPGLYWANFATLVETIESLAEDKSFLPTDREAFLLQELIAFLESEGLVKASEDEVLVVAASTALPDYLQYSAYMCQPSRSFREVERIAFYSKGLIDRRIPKVIGKIESIFLDSSGVDLVQGSVPNGLVTMARDLVGRLERTNPDRTASDPRGSQRWEAKVLFLTAPDSPDTLTLRQDIENDKLGRGGQVVAFTQGQRYVSLKKLLASPKYTSELE